MAKGKGGAKEVGRAKVVLEFVPDEESLAAIGEAVQSAQGKTASSTRPQKTAAAATAAGAGVVTSESKVKVATNVAKQVSSELSGHTYEIKIDVKNLREQIVAALKAPFQITVEANIEGRQGAATAHQASPVLQTARPAERTAVPDRLNSLVGKFSKDIDNLHLRLSEASEAMGKTFGKLGNSGSSIDRAIEILQHFGATDFKGLLTLTENNGRLPKATGGRLSKASLIEAGFAPEHATSIENAARGFTSINDKGEFRQSDALALFKNLAQYLESQPPPSQNLQQETPQAQQRTAAATTPAPVPTAAAKDAMAELATATKTLRKTLSTIPTQAVTPEDLMQKYAVDRSVGRAGVRSPRPDEDPEATARSVQQLGTRNNPRAMLGGFVPRTINGIKVDLEPLLRAARNEEFSGLIKTQKGEVRRFAPGTEEEAARARAASTGIRAFRINDVEGQVENIKPTDAFWDAVSKAFDDDIAGQLKLDPETQNLVRGSLRQGAAGKPFVDPRPPMPGMGGNEAGGIISGSGRGFENTYRAAFRLLDTLDEIKDVSSDIDGLWDKIGDREAAGKSADSLYETLGRREKRLDQLQARAKDLASVADLSAVPALDRQRAAAQVPGSMAAASTPEQKAILRAAAKARDALEYERSGGRYRNASQRVVGEGVGLSDEEIQKNVVERRKQAAAKAMGLGDMQAQIEHQVLEKFQDPSFIGRRINEKGEEETFPESSVSAMSRAFREVTAGIEKPEKGPERALIDKAIGDARRGLFGEREKVIKGQGDTAYATMERRGGLFGVIEREQAEAAANRADSGRGRGRVAKTLGSRKTGAAAASGVPERFDEPMRPATSLDTERQMLQVQYDAEAQKVAESRATKDYKALGFESRSEYVRSELMSPPIKGRGGRTIPAGIKSSVRGEVESSTDVGKRMAEIRKTQAEADAHLARIAAGTGDLGGQRAAAAVTVGSPELYSEMKDVLSTRTAGQARSAYTRNTKDPVSGDETRAAYAKGGGIAGGQPLGGPAPKPTGAWSAKDIASPAGTFHVIIAGQTAPVQVTMAAGGGGGGSSGGGGRGGGGKPPEEPMGPMHGPEEPGLTPGVNRTLFAATEAFDRQHAGRDPLGTRKRPAMRSKSTAQEVAERRAQSAQARREAQDQAYMAGANPSPAEADFLAALAQSSRASGAPAQEAAARKQEAETRRQRRIAKVNDPVGFANEQDREDIAQREMRGQLRTLNRSIPRRGFGASLTDVVSSMAPGSGALERQFEAGDLANREAAEIQAEGRKRAQTRTSRRATIAQLREERASNTTGQPTEREMALTNQYREQIAAGKASNAIIRESTKRFNAFHAEVTKASTVMKAFGAAAAGSVVSTAIGAMTVGLGMAVAAPLIQGVTEGMTAALGPLVERLSGFAGTTGRTQEAYAQSYRSSNDDRLATQAQMGISARLSDAQLAMVSGQLDERGRNVAAAQSIGQQNDLYQVSRQIDAQRQGGYDRSLFRTTGGLFDFQGQGPIADISIGGQASVAENIAASLKSVRNPASGNTGADPIGDFLSDISGVGDNAATRRANDEARSKQLLADNNKQLSFLNNNLKESKFQLVQGGSPADLDKQRDLFAAAGAQGLGEQLADSQLTVKGIDPNGDAFKEVGAFLKSFASGPKLSAQQVLDQDDRAIKAQMAVEDMQRQFQLTVANPQSIAMAEAQKPLGPANAGIAFSKRDDPATVKAVNRELADTQKLYDQINQETESGLAAAKEFVSGTLGQTAGSEFAKSLDHVAAIGKEITTIEVGVQTKQAAYSAHQFSNSIFMANRALKDAKGLVSGIGDSMGAIERQIFNLQRQSQALSLGQTQKQINFQTAVAGFQAPGLSSEEAEARQEQAKLEARYAQKQLDIQKQLFGLQGRQFNKGASRQVGDLERQLNLLQEGREVSLSTAAAEKKVAALTKIQAKENKQVETFYASAVQRTGDVQAQIGKLVAATGDAMNDVGNIVLKRFAVTYREMTKIITGGSSAYGEGGDGGGGDGNRGPGNAAGFLGTVSGTTSLGRLGVVGESAGEAVAIVKNPQQIVSPMGGSGGVTQFIVNINNPVVKSEDDKRRLIADVKRALQTEAAQLLPRRA